MQSLFDSNLSQLKARRAATKQEEVYPPNFAEITECRRKFSRRISVSSAFLGEKVFCFYTAWRVVCNKDFICASLKPLCHALFDLGQFHHLRIGAMQYFFKRRIRLLRRGMIARLRSSARHAQKRQKPLGGALKR